MRIQYCVKWKRVGYSPKMKKCGNSINRAQWWVNLLTNKLPAEDTAYFRKRAEYKWNLKKQKSIDESINENPVLDINDEDLIEATIPKQMPPLEWIGIYKRIMTDWSMI